jgi:hypothetical protein
MDAENVAPPAAPRARASKRGRGLAARAATRAARGGADGPLKPGKLAASAGTAPVARRRALGDITNSARGGGGLGVGAGAKGAPIGKGGPEKVTSAGTRAHVERPVPLGADGEVADVEDIPAAALAYRAAYEPPDLVAELGIRLDEERDDGGVEHPLDELPTLLMKEELPFVPSLPSDDGWDGIAFQSGGGAGAEGWHGADADLGLFAVELPSLSLGPDDV